jgi:methylglutaconyl-CoA hydratase
MNNKEQQGYVRSSKPENGLLRITFHHPSHNSLPSNLLQQMKEQIIEAGMDKRVKVIVLESSGHNTFCAGANFDELTSLNTLEKAHRFFSGFGDIINAMRQCPKIIVVRVHGKAVGGGVGLAAAADYCMATMYGSVRLSELAVGFGPFVIGPAVERKVGVANFSKMALTPAEWQTATWAKESGLFQEVFQTVEQLDAYIAHFCANIATYSPDALMELKTIFWQGTEHWDTLLSERAEISGRLSLTDFTKKAIAKINGK